MSRPVAAIVDEWGRATEDRLRAIFRSAAQDVAENVSVGGAVSPGTPVDTGFARSMWVASLNGDVPAFEKPPKGIKSGDLVAAGDAAASEMALVIATADLGDTITIANRTEYLPWLEDGSTPLRTVSTGKKPTPLPFFAGWIATTVNAWPDLVRLASQRIGSAFR